MIHHMRNIYQSKVYAIQRGNMKKHLQHNIIQREFDDKYVYTYPLNTSPYSADSLRWTASLACAEEWQHQTMAPFQATDMKHVSVHTINNFNNGRGSRIIFGCTQGKF